MSLHSEASNISLRPASRPPDPEPVMLAYALNACSTLLRASAPAARAISPARPSLRARAPASLRRGAAFLGARGLSAPTRGVADGPSMRVAKEGDTVSVHYTGTLESGEQFDSSRERQEPLTFVLGAGAVVPGFEKAVRGMVLEERKKAVLTPGDAYGERTEELVITVPRDRAPTEMALDVGQKVPLTNGAVATVLAVSEEEIKLDANHALAGKTLVFDLQLMEILDSVLSPPPEGLERIVFGLGCFWGAELAFQRVEGVVSTRVGYTQGSKKKPTYRQVCSGQTGHTEAVAVDFDPKKVSVETLVELFWRRLGKNAFTLNQVGNDVGTQYRKFFVCCLLHH